MEWTYDNQRPIYLQLVEKITIMLICGEYKAGDKLPSVRDFASIASVNPNTMQKALSELEQTGVITTQRTSGKFITEDSKMIEKLKEETAITKIKELLNQLSVLGLTKSEIIELINKA